MADIKISELPTGSASDTDVIPVVDGGATKKISLSALQAYIQSMGDNVKAKFGAGDDLQIYHDGDNSYIDDAGTGDLIIRASDQFRVRQYSNNEDMIEANINGGVRLFYDNAAKLATTSTGIDVTGTVTADGVKSQGATYPSYKLQNASAVDQSEMYHEISSNSLVIRNYIAGGDVEIWTNGGGKSVIVDDSGNLLVGKTALDGNTTGFQVEPAGAIAVTRSGSTTAYFNRQTSDGTIIDLRKDGTTVGSIGTSGSALNFMGGAGNDGLQVGPSGGEPYVIPVNNNAIVDAQGSIGLSNYRWKDLYLSGGIYLGGTGAANKLDDYEEGTWTPALTSGTATVSDAIYRKIGDTVIVRALLYDFSDQASGTIIDIGNLPFVGASTNSSVQGSIMLHYMNVDSTAYSANSYYRQTSNSVRAYVARDNAAYVNLTHSAIANSSASIRFTVIYDV